MPGRDVFRKLTLQAVATEKAKATSDGAIFVTSHDVPSQIEDSFRRRDRAGMRSVWHGRHCPFGMGGIARAMEAAMNDRTAL
jgi:hypothetical protein